MQLQQLASFPAHWHPCQVYIILLLSGEGDCFLNSQSTHKHYYTSSSMG